MVSVYAVWPPAAPEPTTITSYVCLIAPAVRNGTARPRRASCFQAAQVVEAELRAFQRRPLEILLLHEVMADPLRIHGGEQLRPVHLAAADLGGLRIDAIDDRFCVLAHILDMQGRNPVRVTGEIPQRIAAGGDDPADVELHRHQLRIR